MSRARKWISGGLAVIAAVLLVLTLVWPDWIEGLFDAEPDHGDGSAETVTTVAFAIVTVLAAGDFLLSRLRARRRADDPR